MFTAGLLMLWLISAISLLALDLQHVPWWAVVAGILVRTQLQTGLFIIGHDAMHRILWPERPERNDQLGAAMVSLYAALPYGACRENHRLHHRFAATESDPDFPSEPHSGMVSWYVQFMAGYLTVRQMGGLLGTWALLAVIFHSCTPTATTNVLVFCTVPLLLSSLQLFVFGTYLPHRMQRNPTRQSHPDSLDWPEWLSFLACFHFGYHREHHDNPGLSWFELPAAHRRARALAFAPPTR